MKNVLMIAYAFPPLNFSGTARPLGFAKYLADFGWYPTVLTRQGTGRFIADEELLVDLENKCDIVRIATGDNDDWPGWVSQKFGFFDAPFRLLKLGEHRFTESFTWRAPNGFPGIKENIHWGKPAFNAALKLVSQKRFDLVWATGDPWTSLFTAWRLSKKLNIPFIADIRDPWTYGAMWNPATERIANYQKRWERRILSHAKRTVYTSPLTTAIMQKRMPSEITDRLVTITNGFEKFMEKAKRDLTKDRCRFSFVGHLWERNKDPKVLLEGWKIACRDKELSDSIELEFVGNADEFIPQADRTSIRIVPPVTQDESRKSMRSADVLVLLQTRTGLGDDVISGKAYEYLAAGKLILAVVPETGGDAWLVRETNAGLVTGTTDPEKIAQAIRHFWQLWKEKKLVSPVMPEMIARFDRRNLTRELAELFDNVLREQGASREPR